MNIGFNTSMSEVPSGMIDHRVINYGPIGAHGVTISLDNGVYQNTVFVIRFSFHVRMSINLIDGAGNKLFHFNPRIAEGHVVLNSKLGAWGPEEIPPSMPFEEGQTYEVVIVNELGGYRVFVDGEEFVYFHQRTPVVPVLLEVEDAMVYLAKYSQGGPQWMMRGTTNLYNMHDFTPMGIDVPFTAQLQRPFVVGSTAIISFFVNNCAERISINLVGPNNEAIFHFNPRFSDNCVVRNTFIGNWGNEERSGGMPFTQGKKFTLAIECQQTGFQTHVNGEPFIFYNHRMPYTNIQKITLDNDVKLLKLAIQG